MNVTFDSNVWRIVASPQTFPEEQSLSDFNTIIDSIRNGLLLGWGGTAGRTARTPMILCVSHYILGDIRNVLNYST